MHNSHGDKHPLVLTIDSLSDSTGQRSSLLLIWIPFFPTSQNSYFPLRPFVRHPELLIRSQLSERHRTAQMLAFERALTVNFRQILPVIRMPATPCVPLSFYPGEWSFQWSEAAWRDQSTISPMASLDTDFKLHTSPQNITPISIHFCSSITYSLTFNHSPPILYLLFPACLERLGRQWADWILEGYKKKRQRGRRRKQKSKFVLILLWVEYFQCMLLNLEKGTSNNGKGLTTASLLVQSMSRDAWKEAKDCKAEDRLRERWTTGVWHY